MITLKTPEEIELLREGGKRLAHILQIIAKSAVSGVSTKELNDKAEELIRGGGDVPSFLGYKPSGSARPYPATLCVSVNNEIVHGISNENPQTLKEGDIVGLDLGLIHKKLFVDSAVTVPVGEVGVDAKKLMDVTKEALAVGIQASQKGNTIGDIGHAIEEFVKPYGYGIVRELGGHGVGHKVHEEPHILNFGEKGTGPKLKPGMVLALEPMLNEGTEKIILASDGHTFKTSDGKRSAHFEHTIAITEGKAEILTKE